MKYRCVIETVIEEGDFDGVALKVEVIEDDLPFALAVLFRAHRFGRPEQYLAKLVYEITEELEEADRYSHNEIWAGRHEAVKSFMRAAESLVDGWNKYDKDKSENSGRVKP